MGQLLVGRAVTRPRVGPRGRQRQRADCEQAVASAGHDHCRIEPPSRTVHDRASPVHARPAPVAPGSRFEWRAWQRPSAGLLAAAQVQLETFRGRLTWHRTPDLPGSPKCAPGNAPWEQVNDLHAATFAGQGTTTERLLAERARERRRRVSGAAGERLRARCAGRKLDQHRSRRTPGAHVRRHQLRSAVHRDLQRRNCRLPGWIVPACSRSSVRGPEPSGRACGAASPTSRTRPAS